MITYTDIHRLLDGPWLERVIPWMRFWAEGPGIKSGSFTVTPPVLPRKE